VSVTAACADAEASAALVAVTWKLPLLLPAVYMPADVIVPPVAVQLTEVFVVPTTVAENCCCAPTASEAEPGWTETCT
jgi:hypothetical protein